MSDLLPILQSIDARLQNLDERVGEIHTGLTNRISSLETSHKNVTDDLKKTSEQCDRHEKLKNVAYGAIAVNLGTVGLWVKSHLGLK